MSSALVARVVAGWALSGDPEAAESPAVDLHWEAPAACPDATDARARLDALLDEAGSGREQAVALTVEVREREGGYTAVLSMTAADGTTATRSLDGAQCEDLAGAAVLIAALAIDPDLAVPSGDPPPADLRNDPPTSPGEPEPVPEPEPEPVPSADLQTASGLDGTTPSTDVEAPPPRRGGVRVTGVVQFGGGLGFGRLALGPSGLARLAGGVQVGAFRGLARVSGHGPSFGTVTAPSGDPGAAEAVAAGVFAAGTVGIAACGTVAVGRGWRFVGCGATDVGIAAGRGRETLAQRSTARAPWWGVEGEVGMERAFSPHLGLAVRADGGVVVARPRFVVDGQGAVCCTRWAAGIRVGVVVRGLGRGQRRAGATGGPRIGRRSGWR